MQLASAAKTGTWPVDRHSSHCSAKTCNSVSGDDGYGDGPKKGIWRLMLDVEHV